MCRLLPLVKTCEARNSLLSFFIVIKWWVSGFRELIGFWGSTVFSFELGLSPEMLFGVVLDFFFSSGVDLEDMDN